MQLFRCNIAFCFRLLCFCTRVQFWERFVKLLVIMLWIARLVWIVFSYTFVCENTRFIVALNLRMNWGLSKAGPNKKRKNKCYWLFSALFSCISIFTINKIPPLGFSIEAIEHHSRWYHNILISHFKTSSLSNFNNYFVYVVILISAKVSSSSSPPRIFSSFSTPQFCSPFI